MAIDLTLRHRTTRFTSDLARYHALDKLWNDCLGQASGLLSSEDVAALWLLNADLRKVLIDTTTESRWFLSTLGDHHETIERNYASMDLPPSNYLARRTGGTESVAGLLSDKFAGFPAPAEAAIASLGSMMEQISEKGQVPGMPRDAGFLCSVGAGMVLGGTLSLQPEFVGVGLIVMAAEC